jgi:hypothetical protein
MLSKKKAIARIARPRLLDLANKSPVTRVIIELRPTMPIDEAEETICLLGRGVVVMPSEGVFPPAVIEKVADKVTLSASKSTSTDPLSVPSKTTERSSPSTMVMFHWLLMTHFSK